MKKNDARIYVPVPAELKARIQAAAEADERTLAAFCRAALKSRCLLVERPDKPVATQALPGDPAGWVWTENHGRHNLTDGKLLVATVHQTGVDDMWNWRVFTRPDVTGMPEEVGRCALVHDAKSSAYGMAVTRWSAGDQGHEQDVAYGEHSERTGQAPVSMLASNREVQ
jgi:hypothetical protein